MVHKCVIRGCKSEWYPGCNLKFHVFPKDSKRRSTWLSVVPLKTKFYEGAKICSLHFKQNDYAKTGHLTGAAKPFFEENMSVLNHNQIPLQCNCNKTVISKVEYAEPDNRSNTSIFDSIQSEDEIMEEKFTIKTNIDEETCAMETLEEQCSGKKTNQITYQLPSQTVSGNDRKPGIGLLQELLLQNRNPYMNQVISGNTFFIQKPKCIDKGSQAKLKTDREKKLVHNNKILAQKLKRKEMSIKRLKNLLAVVKSDDGTTIAEIKNITENFTNISKLFKKPSTHQLKDRKIKGLKRIILRQRKEMKILQTKNANYVNIIKILTK